MAKLKAMWNGFWRYRYLLWNLVSRDFKLKYRRSVLGVAWSVLNPLLTCLVMWAVFGALFNQRGQGIEDFPLFLIIGQLMFNFFRESTTMAMESVLKNGPLLRKRREQWVEPLWKSILSNKGLMPLLWRFFPGHPNLLASWFDGEKPQIAAGESYVRKPIYSREGGNVTIFDGQNNVVDHADGDYADEPMIYQAFQPLPRFGDSYTLIGSWIVDDEACGMGIREDNTLITKDTSRFVPHYIAG